MENNFNKRPKVLEVFTSNNLSERQISASRLAGLRELGFSTAVLLNNHPFEIAGAKWYQDTSGADPYFINRGPLSETGKSFLQKVDTFFHTLSNRKALAITRKINPDIISTTQGKWDCTLGNFLATETDTPHVILLNYPISSNSIGAKSLAALEQAAQVVVYSDFMEKEARDFGINRVTKVYPSIAPYQEPTEGRENARHSIRQEFGIPKEAVVIGMGARIEDSKGQIDVVKAFSSFAQNYQEVYLMFAGSGLGEQHLQEVIKATPYAERIKLPGRRNDINRVFTAWDIAAHPSRDEAFGLATAEASAFGLPVVGYNSGAFPEIIEDKITGFVIPIDSEKGAENIQGLANAFMQLLDNPSLRENMGQAGIKRIAEVFTHQPITPAKKLAELYIRIASNRS